MRFPLLPPRMLTTQASTPSLHFNPITILLQDVNHTGDLDVDGRIITVSTKGRDSDGVYLAQNGGQ
jgi:hypothetical protein